MIMYCTMQQVCCVLLVSILAITLAQEDEGPAVPWQEEGGGQVHVLGSWMRTNKGKITRRTTTSERNKFLQEITSFCE